MEPEEQTEMRFVRAILPWLIAAGALLIYLLTLNHWVTLGSLPIVSKVAGWDWTSSLPTPLLHLATWPFRWLSAGLRPAALNFFSALCAGLTLALLARSVALLPHDRTREQRQRERSEFSLLTIRAAWIPPVLAALVCGLQLTFWEHATAATGEMLDLLCFAYVVRCLLEYRVDERESWLMRLALVYGLAVTNNWAMIGYFPAFLLAIVWIKGVSFFEFRFILRMLGFGIAGLLLYFLLPAVTIASHENMMGFWDLLRSYWGSQKNILLNFPRYVLLLCSLTSLLPLLVMGIRWPSSFGDTSVAGALLTNLMFHLVHGVFLVACIWVAFDPPFSPRAMGSGLPFLTFYYLGALSIGYFSGYFLLVFGEQPEKSWRRTSGARRMLNVGMTGLVWIGLVAVPVGLALKNLPQIRGTNGPALSDFAALTARQLPEQSAIVLSDDATHLLLLEGTLRQRKSPHHYMLLDTFWLPYHIYQKRLTNRYPERWPLLPLKQLTDPIDPRQMAQVITNLNQNPKQSYPVYYLHPVFNHYMEHFYMLPRGLVYELRPYPANSITPPLPDAAEIQENEKFWGGFSQGFAPAVSRLIEQKVVVGEILGRYYSRSQNYWGVRLQQANRLEEARKYFQAAAKFNPDNVAAVVNLGFNERLRTGRGGPVKIEKPELKKYRRWDDFLQVCGPVDEPSFCYNLGQVFASGPLPLPRQAAQQFIRAQTLNPDNLDARFWVANMYLKAGMPDKVLELARDIRSQSTTPLSVANQVELVNLEAWAHYSRKDFKSAEKLLLDGEQKFPRSPEILVALFQMYLGSGEFTNALAITDKQLALATNNVGALMNKGALYIQLKAFDKAIDPLSRILELDPKNSEALINRAIALRKSGKLETAQRDYEELKKSMPELVAVYYGLGDIAYQRKDKSAAIENYEHFLKLKPSNPDEVKEVQARLNELKSGAPDR